MRMRSFVVVFVLLSLLTPLRAQAAGPVPAPAAAPAFSPTCDRPESNAEALVILNNYYPGYWWDHTDLTVAVQAHPSTTEEQLAAIRGGNRYLVGSAGGLFRRPDHARRM